MPIDFPGTPTVGQPYEYNGKTYKYKAAGYWTAFDYRDPDAFKNPFIRNEIIWVYLIPGAHVVPGEATEITYV